MNREEYNFARNTAWKTLIDCQVRALPIDLLQIVRHYGIHIAAYSRCSAIHQMPYEYISSDGFTQRAEDILIIYINDTVKSAARRRFTVAHELGHIVLGHPLDTVTARGAATSIRNSIQEAQANAFACGLLMPAGVLHAIGAESAGRIRSLCGVSPVAATYRADRLAELRGRHMFGSHPLERVVLEQFDDFINYSKNR